MSHGSEESENYWPGYVDALTSMVQVLAFVMMMLAMAVFVLSQSVSKNAVEAIAKAVNADVKPNADVKQLTQAVLEKIQSIQSPSPAGSATAPSSQSSAKADTTKPAPQNEPVSNTETEKMVGLRLSGARSHNEQPPVQPSANDPRFTITFEERSFRIDQERAQSLNKFIGENNIAERAQVVLIGAYAYSGDGALSEARRLAYYRAMIARKLLIDEKVRPENIRINVNDTTDKEKGSTVEMTVIGGSGAH